MPAIFVPDGNRLNETFDGVFSCPLRMNSRWREIFRIVSAGSRGTGADFRWNCGLTIGTTCAIRAGMTMKLLPSAWRNWGATAAESSGPMSGDRKVADPNYVATLAITIGSSPADVWPWLVQLGYRRGGLYSYDWLDRLFGYLDRPSADRVLLEFQQLKVGDAIPVGRGAAFRVTDLKPNQRLVMSGMEAGFAWSWEIALCPFAGHRTRLISRNRARVPETIASKLFMLVLEPAAFLMTRKMLLGIKRRAEVPARIAVQAEDTRVPRSVRATPVEQTEPLPADEIIKEPLGSLTHAITIRGSRADVWPWLAQMGAGRAGWYSYDSVDNGGQRSSRQILWPLQRPAKGTVFPALPGATDGFILLDDKPAEWLVLGWPDRHGRQIVTWAFVLRHAGPNCTRLIVRARGSASYRFYGLPSSIGLPLVRFVHFVMQRKQLLGIANRVERSGATERSLVGTELEHANVG